MHHASAPPSQLPLLPGVSFTELTTESTSEDFSGPVVGVAPQAEWTAADFSRFDAGGLAEAAIPNDASAPPPPPTVFSPAEFEAVLQRLEPGRGELPSKVQLHNFRTLTQGRLLWVVQARRLAATVDGGLHFLREVYERNLLLDPGSLTPEDAPWIQSDAQMPQAFQGVPWALPTPDFSHAGQALATTVTVIRFDGKVAHVSANMDTMPVAQIMEQAATQLGGQAFNQNAHHVQIVGVASDAGIRLGHVVKITGLVQQEQMNGKIGQVIQDQGSQLMVQTPEGNLLLKRENVLPYGMMVVHQHQAFPAMMEMPLGVAGGAAPRLLWLQKGVSDPKMPQLREVGALGAIASQFHSMDVSRSGAVSVGEFRNFLWNLGLDDTSFKKVCDRFAPADSPAGSNYLNLQVMIYLIGRAHLKSPQVPIDALIYEAVLSVLHRKATAHIDRDLGEEDEGMGSSEACGRYGCGYCMSIFFQLVTVVALVMLLVGAGDEHYLFGGIAIIAFLISLGMGCASNLGRAMANKSVGLWNTMLKMDKPRYENPQFTWHIECYHWRTVHYTDHVTRNGKRETVQKTRKEKVVTHRATLRGTIPTIDHTPIFIPLTDASQTEIDTTLELDFSRSNYLHRYREWCRWHRRDVHQSHRRSEDLPSRCVSCMAEWVEGSSPWYMSGGAYWLAHVCLLGGCLRWYIQSRLGFQSYEYKKQCFSI